ncbi:MAG: endonuclease domain-containing protein [Draconibacterium sp.]
MDELDKQMYFGAKPPIFDKATLLRNNQTRAEKMLWERLKNKQICRVRFRRQHPLDIFIADFYCHAARLVVELDGEIHRTQKDYDAARTEEMNNFEVEVIRFKNEEVFTQIDSVVLKITETVQKRLE